MSEKRRWFWWLVSPHQGVEKLRAGTRGHEAVLPMTQLFCSGSSWSGRISPCLPSCFFTSTRSIVPVQGSKQKAVTAVQPTHVGCLIPAAQLITLEWARLPTQVSTFSACPMLLWIPSTLKTKKTQLKKLPVCLAGQQWGSRDTETFYLFSR